MPKLWTYDFTVLILGSLVSLAGGFCITHVLSLYVYDVTDNNPLVGTITSVITYTCGVIIPFLLAGAVAKYQKRKLIYGLDFLNAGILIIMFILCYFHVMNLPTIFFYCVVFGVTNNVYNLSFKSYMPKLVSGQNYSKAFSISSIISTFSETAIVIGTVIYSTLKGGLRDYDSAVGTIFLFSGILFLVAAIFETRIKYNDITPEELAAKKEHTSFKETARTALSYIKSEKALILVCLIGFIIRVGDGALYGIIVPFFRTKVNPLYCFGIVVRNRDLLYSVVMGFYSTGFFWGGLVNYYIKIPANKKASFYFLMFLIEKGLCLLMSFMREPFLMMPTMFIAGFAGMVMNSMQNVVIYSVVPREMTERFTGVYEAFLSLGYIVGLLGSGVIATMLGARNMHLTYTIMFGVSILVAAAVFASRFP
ncbi:MAG: MFS transporter, partial [Oscillospiraceae bacterium]|nr:MFS transporter [Oscillospiraceae bacterium]